MSPPQQIFFKTQTGEICLPASRVQELLEAHNEGVSPWRIFKIMAELVNGFEFLKQCGKAVTFFGSARFHEDDAMYKEATTLASLLAKEGFAIITGGGPGIMEAANKGAHEAGGRSLGINIQLPREQRINKYVKESESFHYFFTRKIMLAFASQVYIYFPGGFGTLDEFFEIVTLVQTKKVPPVPIVLVGKDYWEPILRCIKDDLYERYHTISKEDTDLYHLANSAQEALQFIQESVREEKSFDDKDE